MNSHNAMKISAAATGSEIARPVSMIVLRPRVAIGMSVALAAPTVIVISVAGRNAYAALA
jgi:hypothetical protein